MPRAISILPPHAYLRECFDYEPETGLLRWRKRPLAHFIGQWACAVWNAKHPGQVAGAANNRGYVQVQIGPRKWKAARIIWKLHYGTEPLIIDHIDRNKANNRIENLRSTTERRNVLNRARPPGVSGLTGAYPYRGGFYAMIGINYTQHYLGSFKTAEEAHACYLAELAKQNNTE